MSGPPRVELRSFAEGAARSAGTVVVVDVFRAFTTAAVALSRGAQAIVMVGDLEEALKLRDKGVGRCCMGERGGERPAGFDFGNSPVELAMADLDGETLIQTTSNGTRGVLAAADGGAERIYAGAFATVEATARCVLAEPNDAPVALVAMGHGDRVRSDEDELCALYLRARIEGRRPDGAALVATLRSLLGEPGTTERLFKSLSVPDIDYCLEFDRFPFAVRVEREDGLLVARKEPAPSPP